MAGIAAPIDFDSVRIEQAIQGVAGWRDVAEKALEFVKRFTTITARTARSRGGLR
jgi:hypothetical protein